ncbi:MAG: VOC family protein [Proteobacteria bacterium]|nr:MAG: VOC family protein [Pseudomonadota bacterium]
MPYLYFDGECEDAITFYQSVLGGEIPYIGRYGDMPAGENGEIEQPDDADKVMHVSLELGDGFKILASDVPSNNPGFSFKPGNNVALSIDAKSRQEADKIFFGLSEGGVVTMPIADTFWGAYFGMWTDKFGISWMVNFDDPEKAGQ